MSQGSSEITEEALSINVKSVANLLLFGYLRNESNTNETIIPGDIINNICPNLNCCLAFLIHP